MRNIALRDRIADHRPTNETEEQMERPDRRRRALACAAAVLLATPGCEPGRGPTDPLEELPRQLTVAEQEVIASSNNFAFRLLRQVAEQEPAGDNIILSPFSVSMALGLAMNGAAGQTYDEIRSTLGLQGLDEGQINGAYRGLSDLLLGLDGRVELTVANSVWALDGTPVEERFLQTARDDFEASVHRLDFAAPEAPSVVNTWVRDATRGRIEQIVGTISPLTVMLLLNAVYFKGQWSAEFDIADTRLAAFYLDSQDAAVEVETMHSGKGVAWAFGGAAVEGVEIPYGNQAFTMTVVMPPEGTPIDGLIDVVDAEQWDRWLGRSRVVGSGVSLPRWEMRGAVGLKTALAEMGMRQAFAAAPETDFSRLTHVPAYISGVQHNTRLRVDESGTEAAAATRVTIESLAGAPVVHVNRPFLVAIRERLSGTILVVGIVRDPR